jgi:hypothetical protein
MFLKAQIICVLSEAWVKEKWLLTAKADDQSH